MKEAFSYLEHATQYLDKWLVEHLPLISSMFYKYKYQKSIGETAFISREAMPKLAPTTKPIETSDISD